MSKAIQSNTKSNSDNSRHGLFHKIIFELRHGLKRNHKFLDLFPYLKIFFPWRSGSFIQRTAKLRVLMIFATLGFAVLALATIVPIASEMIPAEAATGTAKNSTLTMSVTNPSAEVNLTVASTDGTFASSSPNATFTVTTDNYSGYTLSIQGKDDNGLLSDKKKQNSFTSISSAISEATFKAAANKTYNGQWGYKPSKVNSVANSNYLPAPTTTATVLDVTSAANSAANSYTIGIGARADFSMLTAEYTNTFTITAIANLVQYSIAYNGNAADATNVPATQTDATSGTSVVLSSTIPSRTGATFLGWCNVQPTRTGGVDSCSGTTFAAGATYGIDKTASNTTTLYAMWEMPTLASISNMQQMTTTVCANTAVGETKRLTDTRDQKTYWVAKLADGNCWMTQNLDLDITTAGLSVADTDITEDWNSSSTYAPTATATGNAPTSGQVATDTKSYDPGDYVLNKPGSWQYCTTNAGTLGSVSNCTSKWTDVSSYTSSDYDSSVNGTVSGASIVAVDTANKNYDAHYHAGNYYQFNTATAGKGATVTTSQGEVADSSICPKGWKLPLSGANYNDTDGSFYKLLNSYGIVSGSSANSLKYVSAPLYLVPGGGVDYNSNGLGNAGRNGFYWSQVSYDASSGYYLYFYPSFVFPSVSNYRYRGFSVRCVAPGS